MAAPAAGTAYAGKTGALAITSTDASPSLRYFPLVSFNPQTARGISVPRQINNAIFPANYIRGKAMTNISLQSFLYLGLINADFITRAVLNQPDTSAGGYNSCTMYPNNLGSAAENYFRAKFSGLSISASSLGDETAALSMGLLSIDPESTGTALATPPTGPLSAGLQIASFCDFSFTGASNVSAISFAFNTGLDIVGGCASGTNSTKYPKVPAGILQADLTGTVSLTQIANPATILCGSTLEDTLTIAIGPAGTGIQFVLKCIPIGENRPVPVGLRYERRTYQLYGGDGSSPVAVTNL